MSSLTDAWNHHAKASTKHFLWRKTLHGTRKAIGVLVYFVHTLAAAVPREDLLADSPERIIGEDIFEINMLDNVGSLQC
jgi:hypothetical protein